MLRWLNPRLPYRSTPLNYTNITLDDARSKVIFSSDVLSRVHLSPEYSTRSDYLVTNYLPPAPSPPSDPEVPNSSLCPPFHIHLKEDEKFYVISGTAKFLLFDQHIRRAQSTNNASTSTQNGMTKCLASPGTTTTIPKGQIHTFRNASATHPLHIEFGFKTPSPELTSAVSTSHIRSPQPELNEEAQQLNAKMHRFFLNTQLYRSDCSTQNIPRSLLQVLLFNHYANVALVPNWLLSIHRRLPLLRSLIERFIAPALGRTMNLLGGVVLGKWVFGLKESYAEYYPYDQVDDKGPEKRVVDAKIGDELKRKQDDNPWACQAWRDHSFDGQSEDWRK